MARKRQKTRHPRTKAAGSLVPVRPPSPEHIRLVHGRFAPSVVYAMSLDSVFGEESAWGEGAYAQDVIERMGPRDPAEELLVAQMLCSHARVLRLTDLANKQTTLEGLRVMNEYADRASNTFRRLMLALAEYRRPARSGDLFAVVRQANIAGQQVVSNHRESGQATNEQGSGTAGDPAAERRRGEALPADGAGASVAPPVDPSDQAMGTFDRTPDAGGKGSVPVERHEAR